MEYEEYETAVVGDVRGDWIRGYEWSGIGCGITGGQDRFRTAFARSELANWVYPELQQWEFRDEYGQHVFLCPDFDSPAL